MGLIVVAVIWPGLWSLELDKMQSGHKNSGVGAYDIRNGSAIDIDSCWEGEFDGFVFDHLMDEMLGNPLMGSICLKVR